MAARVRARLAEIDALVLGGEAFPRTAGGRRGQAPAVGGRGTPVLGGRRPARAVAGRPPATAQGVGNQPEPRGPRAVCQRAIVRPARCGQRLVRPAPWPRLRCRRRLPAREDLSLEKMRDMWVVTVPEEERLGGELAVGLARGQ